MRLEPHLKRLSIIDKDGNQVRFRMNWAQQKYLTTFEDRWNQGKPVRTIVLKARQLGISTLTEAIIFLLCLHIRNQRSVVIGNDIDNAQHLLSMTANYWDTYPFARFHDQKYGSRNELAWKDMNSSIKVATAANAKAGRGKTIRALHASEVAFWENAKTTMSGLTQAIPTRPETYINLESTAHGVGGYFYDQWHAAEAGDTDYIPIFFPWHTHYEYRASYIGLDYFNLGNLDSEERALRAMGLSDDSLAWRRWAIRNLTNNDINTFHQEYPVNPEEAFISTGTNVFPVAKLREAYQPMDGLKGRLVWDNGVRFQPDMEGPLTLFRMPSKDKEYGVYSVGGDPTHTTRGDFACGQVINRRTLEQVAVLNQRVDPGNFGIQLDLLGQFYNEAMVAPEVEGPGYATVATMIERNYPNLWENKVADTTPGKHSQQWGWRTTAKSKELAIGLLLKLLVDGDITIHHAKTFEEMRTYVTLENGGYGNADGTPNDDTVMALAIAVVTHMLEPPLVAFGMGERIQETPWENWGEMENGE
jgi:hypothetical protein